MTSSHHRLQRLFKPHDIAIVGASETGVRARNAIDAMTKAGHRLHLINRRGEPVLGQVTSRSLEGLADSGVVPDAAMIFTNAAAAIDVTASAARLGVGGIVVNAGGFAEAGSDGEVLQQRLVEAAGAMPLLGPNCNGIIAPSLGLHLAGSPTGFPIRTGRIAFVTHSGATMLPMGLAGAERRIGFSYLVSTGNEAAVDMAEVIDFLATDPATAAICLLVETIRNPPAFWAAIDRAITAGKPVLALKNGRSERGRAIAKSHTGAVAGDAWVYSAALRQHGVILADDLVDLADRAVLFDQLPPSGWTAARGVVVLSGSGGYVTMASDVCAEEGLGLPELEDLLPAIRDVVSEASLANPLDLTGAAMVDPAVMKGALQVFASSAAVDTILIQSPVCSAAAGAIGTFAGPALELAPASGKLFVIGSVEGGEIGALMQDYIDRGIAVARGLRATVRAIRAMGDFVRFAAAPRLPVAAPAPIAKPAAVLTHAGAGRMLGFAETMCLLSAAGVPTAPFVLVESDDATDPAIPFAPPFVVKLADVPHRTDIGAVRLNVAPEALRETIEELRALAARHGERAAIAIQPQVAIAGELLVGVNAAGDLGPMVVAGPGGVLVELLRQVSGRLAPFSDAEAMALVDEVDCNGILSGPRGSMPWPKRELAEILRQVGAFAAGASDWLETLDINPLVLTPGGICAVDGLIILRSGPATAIPAPLFQEHP